MARGSIEVRVLPDGRKRYDARHRDSAGKSRSRTFSTKANAERHLNQVHQKMEKGEWVGATGRVIRFSEFADEVNRGKFNLRPPTVAKNESLLRNHILPTFGEVQVTRILPDDVNEWINVLLKKGLSIRTVVDCHALFSSFMNIGVDEGVIPRSPTRRTKLPEVKRREARYLTPEEVIVLADCVHVQYKALVFLGAYLGCRWQELAGLWDSSVDLDKGSVRIVGTIERTRGKYRPVSLLKSDASWRTLSVPAPLAPVLETHRAEYQKGEYFFSAPSGGFLRYDNFRRRVWQPAVVASGLARPLSTHALRHTCAAMAIDKNVNPYRLQRWLGHADIKTTLNRYGHLYDREGREVAETLGRIYEQAVVGNPGDSSDPN